MKLFLILLIAANIGTNFADINCCDQIKLEGSDEQLLKEHPEAFGVYKHTGNGEYARIKEY